MWVCLEHQSIGETCFTATEMAFCSGGAGRNGVLRRVVVVVQLYRWKLNEKTKLIGHEDDTNFESEDSIRIEEPS